MRQTSESLFAARHAITPRRRRGALLSAAVLLVTLLAVIPLASGAQADTATKAAAPAITVSPATALRDGQAIDVVGTGFPARAKIQIGLCIQSSPTQTCPSGVKPVTDSTGKFTARLTATRFVSVGERLVDCAAAGLTPCTVVASVDGAAGNTATQAVTFDITAPALPAFTVGVTLTGGGLRVNPDGTATATGTVTCSANGTVSVFVRVTQPIRFLAPLGEATTTASCTTLPKPWTVDVPTRKGTYINGAAIASITATHDYPAASATFSGTTSIRGALLRSQYYVALGDSLAWGVGSGAGTGYADNLAASMRLKAPGLGLANFACEGDTSTTMTQASTCSYRAGSQVAEAETFLALQKGKISLVTFELSGLEVLTCGGKPPASSSACFKASLAKFDTNVKAILARLRKAAGPGVPIVGVNTFNPIVSEWFAGSSGQARVKASAMAHATLNSHLNANFRAAGARIADVGKAYASQDFTLVNSSWGRVPKNVATGCQLLSITCSKKPVRYSQYPNVDGYAAMSKAISDGMLLTYQYRSLVQAVYDDFLGLVAGPTVIAKDAPPLADGSTSQRTYVTKLAGGKAGSEHKVQVEYQAILGRAPDAAGLKYWSEQLRTGKSTTAELTATLLASDEAFALHGGTTESWVDAVSTELIGSAATASRQAAWVAQANANGRYSVAYELVQSPDAAQGRVKRIYVALLGRSPDAAGLKYWTAKVIEDGEISLAVELGASREYTIRASERFRQPVVP